LISRSSLTTSLIIVLLLICGEVTWASNADQPRGLTEGARMSPLSATQQNELGLAHMQEGDLDLAIASFDEAIRMQPEFAIAYCNRGLAWKKKGQFDKAVLDYGKAIELNPMDPIPFNCRGIVWLKTRNYERAICDFNEAIRLNPALEFAHDNRGLAWYRKENIENALIDFNKAIELWPEDSVAYQHRGEIWVDKKEYEKAVADYDQAIKLDAKNLQALNLKAWFRATCPDEKYRNGQEAVDLAIKACELSQWKEFEFVDTLAAACAESNDFVSAEKHIASAMAIAPVEKKDWCNERLADYKNRKPYRESQNTKK